MKVILKAYAIYDSKTQTFSQPMFMQSHGSMMRAWVDHVNESGSNIGKHPEDYILYEIGSYDDEKAVFECIKHVSLGVASEVKR